MTFNKYGIEQSIAIFGDSVTARAKAQRRKENLRTAAALCVLAPLRVGYDLYYSAYQSYSKQTHLVARTQGDPLALANKIKRPPYDTSKPAIATTSVCGNSRWTYGPVVQVWQASTFIPCSLNTFHWRSIMKSPTLTLFVSSVLILSSMSCSSATDERSTKAVPAEPAAAAPAAESRARTAVGDTESSGFLEFKKVSLDESKKAEVTSLAAVDRKIIRNADLTMEVASTTDTQHRVVSIAEAHGGFVVTSEAKQRESTEPAKRTLDFKLIVRVPENHFGSALDQIRGLASNLTEEKISGQDVTEEFIDLEARIRTQKALEAQFLQIMRQTGKIVDALEVQRQIAEVRSDIERLEGRKRFLENRSSLSTITVNIVAPKPMVVVPTTGFRNSLREALSDSIDVGSAIVLFFVRFAIVMIPVGLFVLLPAGLVVRYFIRRAKRMRMAEALSAPTAG